MANDFHHALLIGGTGMLAGATRAIADRASTVTLVARDQTPMRDLVGSTPANFVAVDYTDVDAFVAGLETARALSGDYDLVVAWIHTRGDPALDALTGLFVDQPTALRFVHIIGSRGPSMPEPTIAALEHVAYQRVLLGHVVVAGEQRWLTHDEISAGAIGALETTEDVTVGTIDR